MAEPTLRAVLFDADGVVQQNPPGWFDDLHRCVPAGRGRAFVDDIFETEKAAMTGRREVRDVLEEVTARWGLPDRVDRLIGHWRRIDVCASTVELVRELRASGMPCFLASNQQAYRASHMRHELGYDTLFDGQFYSCDLGVLKSSPVFFRRVLDALGLPAAEVCLVDDSEEYVETAGECGLRAVTWSIDDGTDALRARLDALR